MVSRISPHVTVLRRAPDAESVRSALREAAHIRSCRLHLGTAARAPLEKGGAIYLQVTDPYGDLSLLRDALRDSCNEPGVMQALAHVTVVHPRTVPPERVEQAWAELHRLSMSEDFVVSEIALIGEFRDKWETIERISLDRRT